MGARANILRGVHKILEADTDLVTALGHMVESKSVTEGARIVGNSVRLEELPLPLLILDFDSGAPGSTNDLKTWDAFIDIAANDVFQAADLLDMLEDVATNYVTSNFPSLPHRINNFVILNHQRLEPQQPGGVIAVRVNFRVTWV
jgi:hypothetical protein